MEVSCSVGRRDQPRDLIQTHARSGRAFHIRRGPWAHLHRSPVRHCGHCGHSEILVPIPPAKACHTCCRAAGLNEHTWERKRGNGCRGHTRRRVILRCVVRRSRSVGLIVGRRRRRKLDFVHTTQTGPQAGIRIYRSSGRRRTGWEDFPRFERDGLRLRLRHGILPPCFRARRAGQEGSWSYDIDRTRRGRK